MKTFSGNEVFTLGGEVIVHDNRAELEFLFPGRQFVDVTNSVLPKMSIKNHPQCSYLRWPLRREDFW
jgi:hypothetical protein